MAAIAQPEFIFPFHHHQAMKTFIVWVGVILMALGIGHCIYMEYWVYGDTPLYQMTPRQRIGIWGPGAVSMVVGWICFKIGSDD